MTSVQQTDVECNDFVSAASNLSLQRITRHFPQLFYNDSSVKYCHQIGQKVQ